MEKAKKLVKSILQGYVVVLGLFLIYAVIIVPFAFLSNINPLLGLFYIVTFMAVLVGVVSYGTSK